MNTTETISLTFGDAGENHVGNQLIGKIGSEGDGFTCDELKQLASDMHGEYHSFGQYENEEAGIAVFRNVLDEEEMNYMFQEMTSFDWDTKYYDVRRKKVLNKKARHNVLFMDGFSQEPDYENKKGRIVDTKNMPIFTNFRKNLFHTISETLGFDKINDLICEGNYYYDNRRCGIGFHGDSERRKVIALRLGGSMKMKWRWYHNSEIIGDTFEFEFNGGDLYIMSEKAVGHDWKKRSKYTLRHAAGCEKYIK